TGLDLDCGDFYPKYTKPAIDQGKVRESDVDKALKNLYIVLMRLGYFDGSPQYKDLGKDDVCSEEHIELAADSARQGIVLLKNNNLLPLSPTKYKKLAVVGPQANATKAMIGNYAGIPCRYVSPLEGLSKYAEVDYKMGCDQIICRNETFIFHAVEASKHSDATIIFVGLDLSVENEGLDRTNLVLPGYQTQLIREIADAAKSPVIVVVLSAGGVDINFAKNNGKIGAILWAGYPGEEGGRAIADVIFGKYNPGGRLPVTWYTQDYVDKLPMTSMQLRPNDALGYPGRTYKFFNGSTVYPFGYGLSYTHFDYSIKSSRRSLVTKKGPYQHCHALHYKSDAYVPPCPSLLVEDTKCDQTIDFEIEVHNNGTIDGSHVLMVYSIPPADYVGAPAKQLVGFQRVFVRAGRSVTAKFSLDACKTLSMVTDTAYIVLPWGEHTIQVGDGDGAVTFPVEVSFQ
ncbi:probable beta-D-xylosidase 5, partial [Magnolia sinica]|uniref:probable beta-D-xylosidase 5 n=1 Tax=Magnolia sinica TaxID=86752 RepID=UPI002657D733